MCKLDSFYRYSLQIILLIKIIFLLLNLRFDNPLVIYYRQLMTIRFSWLAISFSRIQFLLLIIKFNISYLNLLPILFGSLLSIFLTISLFFLLSSACYSERGIYCYGVTVVCSYNYLTCFHVVDAIDFEQSLSNSIIPSTSPIIFRRLNSIYIYIYSLLGQSLIFVSPSSITTIQSSAEIFAWWIGRWESKT